MLGGIRYVNHVNEVIEFGKDGLIIRQCDLLNFTWKIMSKNERISGFKKTITNRILPIIIKCHDEEDAYKLINKLHEVTEKDVLSKKPGKIIIGGFYMTCFITESKKTDYVKQSNYMQIQLKVSTDMPYWVKETSSIFNYGGGVSGADLDYNRDYAYDYTSNLLGKQLINTSFVDTNFRMIIYGACENPRITVGGHNYEVYASVGANEYLTIDSVNKTIVLTHRDGTQENCYKLRNTDSYVFKKMPSGVSNVSASGSFKFDIVLLEERGEPKWT